MFVGGIDGCKAGWVMFQIDVASRDTSVRTIDLPALLLNRPRDLALVGIDIPIGLLDGPRRCDVEARKLLGRSRRSSVFPSPCRATLRAQNYMEACQINFKSSGRKLSKQSWAIAPKIKQVDDVMTPAIQKWAFEVHPEVCFWAMNGKEYLLNAKKCAAGMNERLLLLRNVLPYIDRHLEMRPAGVSRDDLLDAAAATRPMDPRETAAYLHLDDKTITRWSRLGYIPAHPLGQGKKKYWRFYKYELDAWLNNQNNWAVAA